MKENSTFRKWLGKTHPGAAILEPGHCDEAILGVRDGCVVYGYEELCESYAREFRRDVKDSDDAYQMAVDWVEYNTLRTLPYISCMAPIVAMYDPEMDCLVDTSDVSEEPEPLEFERNCPGLVS